LHYNGNLKQVGDRDTPSTIYRSVRLYSSGRLDDSNLSNGLGATDSYVTDIANLHSRHDGFKWSSATAEKSWRESLFDQLVFFAAMEV
jgi:hypothetical protein